MYAVVITDQGGAQRTLDFSKPELTVGRVQGNDIVLSKRNVSKQHARLTLKGEQAVVADLNSTNGTLLNGRQLAAHQRVQLTHGDTVSVCDSDFPFLYPQTLDSDGGLLAVEFAGA